MKIILVGKHKEILHYSKKIEKDQDYELVRQSEVQPTSNTSTYGTYKKTYTLREIFRPTKSKKKHKNFSY